GWVFIAAAIALQVLVLPFLRFGLLTAALGVLGAGGTRPWVGRAFRWSERFDTWAMPDVYLIGCLVGYSRMAPYVPVDVGNGGWCVIGAAIFTMLTRATLDRHRVWER